MPERTRVPCGWPGCAALVAPGTGHCILHRKERWSRQNYRRRTDPVEAKLDRFYSTRTWQRCRMMYIRAHPVCVGCGQPATEVDHVVPRRDGGASLDPNNLQSLCKSCHAIKTSKETYGRIR